MRNDFKYQLAMLVVDAVVAGGMLAAFLVTTLGQHLPFFDAGGGTWGFLFATMMWSACGFIQWRRVARCWAEARLGLLEKEHRALVAENEVLRITRAHLN